jgi:hypothetical protein
MLAGVESTTFDISGALDADRGAHRFRSPGAWLVIALACFLLGTGIIIGVHGVLDTNRVTLTGGLVVGIVGLLVAGIGLSQLRRPYSPPRFLRVGPQGLSIV